ncbi:hypothetical protein [Actinophytocola oryzae]|uniref:Sporulation and spore germination protein n=1 Tax=Actinophytocola oryzae TaxID=502181 RepID=A0A4V6Q6W9_9PSEU|nr:hypothetical protein [Actinophytocola oryzae]TDV53741.1 hypothetical protein CLV71_104209 [Actinophytocola oryzae]
MRAAALLPALAVVLVACSSPTAPVKPSPTTTAFTDEHLRPVRMTSGLALTYLAPEVASQVLCQLMDGRSWARLVGGRIGRKPATAHHAGCLVTTEHGTLTVQMRAADPVLQPDTTVAGRPARLHRPIDNVVAYVVGLTDDAFQRSEEPGRRPSLRLLEVLLQGGDDPDASQEVVTRVVTTIVPLLVQDGDPLPAIDDAGRIPYTHTPSTPGGDFVDLPLPVQALQLCTAMLDVAGVVASQVDVSDSGACRLTTAQGQVVAETSYSANVAGFTDTVAGRPADLGPSVSVSLREDADAALRLTAPDAVSLAGKVAPLLL